MEKIMTLFDAYPNAFFGEGIFSNMVDVPWIDDIDLDLLFFSKYGDRPVAPIIEKLMVDGVLSNEKMEKISSTILKKYINKWTRLYDVTKIEYNPIDNYNMNETSIVDVINTNTRVGSDTESIDETTNVSDSSTSNNTRLVTDTDEFSSNTTLERETSNETTEDITDKLTRDLSTNESTDNTLTRNLSTSDTTENLLTRNLTTTDTGSDKTDYDVFGFNSVTAVKNNIDNNTTSNTKTETGTEQSSINRNVSDTGTEQTTGINTKAETGTEQTDVNRAVTDTGSVTDDTSVTSSNEKSIDEKVTNTTSAENAKTSKISRELNNNITDNGSNKTTSSLNRQGNIGVTTTQQMLESEIKLWGWNFFDTVFDDVLSIVALKIYVKI